MTDRPELPPHILAAADQVKAARPAVRLCYAEDLVQGMVVLVDRVCPLEPLYLAFDKPVPAHDHVHGQEQRTVLEVRTGEDAVSAVLIGEDGEQYPLTSHRLGLHPIIATVRPT